MENQYYNLPKCIAYEKKDCQCPNCQEQKIINKEDKNIRLKYIADQYHYNKNERELKKLTNLIDEAANIAANLGKYMCHVSFESFEEILDGDLLEYYKKLELKTRLEAHRLNIFNTFEDNIIFKLKKMGYNIEKSDKILFWNISW